MSIEWTSKTFNTMEMLQNIRCDQAYIDMDESVLQQLVNFGMVLPQLAEDATDSNLENFN